MEHRSTLRSSKINLHNRVLDRHKVCVNHRTELICEVEDDVAVVLEMRRINNDTYVHCDADFIRVAGSCFHVIFLKLKNTNGPVGPIYTTNLRLHFLISPVLANFDMQAFQSCELLLNLNPNNFVDPEVESNYRFR